MEPPDFVENYVAVPEHLENLQQDPRLLKNIYKKVLIHSKHSKNPQKSPKNSQISQEPLCFAPRPSNHSKILEYPITLLKRPFSPESFQSPYLLIQSSVFRDSCAQILRIHRSFYSCIHTQQIVCCIVFICLLCTLH
jgi:hypothetical protein